LLKPINFTIQKKLDGHLGRAGLIETPHGSIETPAFVSVGTKATIKGLTPEMLRELGAQVVLANTYHLFLQPGDEVVKMAGGLHSFMNWQGPTMTDSGGFQVFSLGAAYGKGISKVTKEIDPQLLLEEAKDDPNKPRIATIDSDGVTFKSHLDGSTYYITPEKSIDIQHNLGADIIFAFDECTSPIEPTHYQREAMDRTHRWAKRSLDYHKSKENSQRQALFGIVQGGRYENLRKESAEELKSMDFDGYGIGGSFAKEDMTTAVRWVNEILPEEKPRHLLGIGEPEDLFSGVENGVDLFDCVAPTRAGRNGTLYTKIGKINLMNAKFVKDFSPIDDGCACYTCKNYTKAYLSHLFRAKEMLAGTLSSIHNLYFIINLVHSMRVAILDGGFEDFKKAFLQQYNSGKNL
jgi:queuine tRNA-ribosyltransferase